MEKLIYTEGELGMYQEWGSVGIQTGLTGF